MRAIPAAVLAQRHLDRADHDRPHSREKRRATRSEPVLGPISPMTVAIAPTKISSSESGSGCQGACGRSAPGAGDPAALVARARTGVLGAL